MVGLCSANWRLGILGRTSTKAIPRTGSCGREWRIFERGPWNRGGRLKFRWCRWTWRDAIEAAANTRPPTCPFCGSVLFHFPDERSFWAGSVAYEKEHSGYVALLRWLKGRCFKTMAEAAAAYESETGIHYEVK